MRFAATTLILALLLVSAALAAQGSESEALRAEFSARIEAAYGAADRRASLLALFHLAGVDEETRAIYERTHVWRILARYDSPHLAFEPLPDDFYPVQVASGYEYRPNLDLLGYVVLTEERGQAGGSAKIPYGLSGGRYYFSGVIRTAVDPDAPPDKALQMIVVGIAVPPPKFSGYCDVMQSNGQLRRLKIEDNGHGNNTIILSAQYIERCRITSDLSGEGSLSLRLLEGDEAIFRERIEAPQTTITWQR